MLLLPNADFAAVVPRTAGILALTETTQDPHRNMNAPFSSGSGSGHVLARPEALHAWMTAAFAACGVSAADAARTSEVLLRTSLRGIDTHGLARVPTYIDKLLSGEVNVRAWPGVESHDGVIRVDGDGGLGQVVATRALHEAMARAQKTATAVCTVRNSGHLSALGALVVEAAEQGLVAFLCQKTPPVIAMPGARGRAIGNNPLAFAMPVAGRAPLVFDMAASVTAFGNVVQALREGRPAIPEGWAIGPDGEPTTDPVLARQGAMLPMAGHKGIGLAMMVECLAGSLVGEMQQADSAAGSSPSGVSAFLMVLNPDLFIGRSAFDASVRSWLAVYLQAGGEEARYPGMRQAECEQERRRTGVPIAPGLLNELKRAGARVNQPLDMA